jgi:hypothetical protein
MRQLAGTPGMHPPQAEECIPGSKIRHGRYLLDPEWRFLRRPNPPSAQGQSITPTSQMRA